MITNQDDSEISINTDSMYVDDAVSGDSNHGSDTTNVLDSEKEPILDQDCQDRHDAESPGSNQKLKREDHDQDQDQCNCQTVSLPMCPTSIKAGVSVMVPLSASVLPAAAASAPIYNEDLDSILMPPPPPSRPSSPSSTSLKCNQRRGRRPRSNAIDLTHEFVRRDGMDHNTTTSKTNSTAGAIAINVGDACICTRDPMKTETQAYANANASPPCSVWCRLGVSSILRWYEDTAHDTDTKLRPR
jgi:hypothetical protein